MAKIVPGYLEVAGLSHQQIPKVLETQQPPVLIVGMHNSGTSILSEVIHDSGIFLGNNMEHTESHFFSIFVNDLLIMSGITNWAQLPLMPIDKVMSFKATLGPFIQKGWIPDYLQWGWDGVSPWGIKDPRLCVLFPLYLDLFPKAKVVHIKRNPDDVAASLSGKKKRGVGVLDNFDHWKALALAYTGRVQEYAGRCHAFHELQYEDFCTKSEDVTRKLFKFLDLPFTEKTRELLVKVTPSQIGSFERRQKALNT